MQRENKIRKKQNTREIINGNMKIWQPERHFTHPRPSVSFHSNAPRPLHTRLQGGRPVLPFSVTAFTWRPVAPLLLQICAAALDRRYVFWSVSSFALGGLSR